MFLFSYSSSQVSLTRASQLQTNLCRSRMSNNTFVFPQDQLPYFAPPDHLSFHRIIATKVHMDGVPPLSEEAKRVDDFIKEGQDALEDFVEKMQQFLLALSNQLPGPHTMGITTPLPVTESMKEITKYKTALLESRRRLTEVCTSIGTLVQNFSREMMDGNLHLDVDSLDSKSSEEDNNTLRIKKEELQKNLAQKKIILSALLERFRQLEMDVQSMSFGVEDWNTDRRLT